MFYKIMHGNMLIDLLHGVRWVRYLPRQKRMVATDSQSANGIMGSDNNTIYHLSGRPNTFDKELKTVEVIQITEAEYSRLSTEFAMAKQENENLHAEVAALKEQLANQSLLLEQILSKLG